MKPHDQHKIYYEMRWSALRDAAAKVVAQGERDLSRIISETERLGLIPKRVLHPKVDELMAMEHAGFVSQRVHRAFVITSILKHASGVDAVVELGSGWGQNLFGLWLAGGPNVVYHAHELDAAGREACEIIAANAAMCPKVISYPCDIRSLDLKPLEGVNHALVVTAYTIDKVRELPADFVEQILSLAPNVTVLHFENISYQLSDNPEGAAYAERMKKNIDLYRVLNQAVESKRIIIDAITSSACGGTTVIIRWHALKT